MKQAQVVSQEATLASQREKRLKHIVGVRDKFKDCLLRALGCFALFFHSLLCGSPVYTFSIDVQKQSLAHLSLGSAAFSYESSLRFASRHKVSPFPSPPPLAKGSPETRRISPWVPFPEQSLVSQKLAANTFCTTSLELPFA